ncbi:HupE/UreJ family protein [Thalassobaculum sp. OXR-137]|uniref:HupE/UreJ family protein n=1 Tax=Thalassobaculum sp. OXR-137 TaxID=3100173 RepID=UPI002AC8C3DE|nr:HupE/UreJ family protein [Thalassobaculum sp. OXR-137]WPZ33605.1 HupE/UreJ family protein [Thalassobaculum sp. OXR-137]
MRSLPVAALTVAVLGLFTTSAFAHTGAGPTGSFLTGFMHPLGGLDHILTMVAVGTMAAVVGGRAMWSVPCAFIAMMMLGAVAGASGYPLPLVEVGIAASIVVTGLATTFGRSLTQTAAVGLAGVFAVFHGHAHGTEMGPMLTAVEYGAGFALATALLHAAGLFGALVLTRRFSANGMTAIRVAGVTIAAVGAGMMGTMI